MRFHYANAAVVAAVASFFSMSAASASESLNYRCQVDGLFSFIETIPEEGRAKFESAGSRFYLDAKPGGFYGNDRERVSFDEQRRQGYGTLQMGNRSFSCEQVVPASGQAQQAGGYGQGQQINVVGQSLGGKLRSGPGMNYRQTGSVSEGTWLTILNNTGVHYDGYDWFEVVFDNGARGYQWGGIMCSNGPRIQGIYSSCQTARPAAPAPQPVASTGGRGFMAFAVGRNGAYGHGAGPTRREAERFALQYCGGAGCSIMDVTDAQCHAMAVVPGANWFGAGQSRQAAQNFAMGFCSNAGARGCRIEYTYCQ
ncbi:DUF4189 domain-containing protein [Roseibium sp.]|uniref:DUF4189 domain-containing protein n=1 Tax=Roseibium sp. TaxID=1936156 RepID=UPI003A96B45D